MGRATGGTREESDNVTPITTIIEINKNISDSVLKVSSELQITPVVESVSETTSGTNSTNAQSLQVIKATPTIVGEFATTATEISTETTGIEWAPREKYSIDLAQLSWLRGEGVEYRDRSFSLILGFTAGKIYEANQRTQTTYTTNTQTYSNGTSSSGVTVTEQDLGLSLGERDGGCGASLSFNVFKEYEDFSVTYAIGVAYGFMTDEAKELVKRHVNKSTLSYFPADIETIGEKMTFVNSTDVVDGAWFGISFNY